MCSTSRWAHPSTFVRAALLPALLLCGAAPAPAPPPNGGGQGLFAQALEAVRRGDHAETARLCWAYLKAREGGAKEAGAADKAESANFYLGEALERLGLTHAAIDRYSEIVSERRVPQLVPRALQALERLSRAQRHDEEAIAQEGVLSAAEFEELPPQLASFVHYRQAIDDLRRGYETWALRHFDRIRTDTPYHPLALYARAVWRVGRGEVDAALGDLGKAIAHDKAPPDLRARALHTRARLLYERGRFDEAYADLDKVDVRYETGGEILLEKAWAKYRSKDFRTALGLLHALGAPAYVDRFAPERYLLRSLIFGKYCHFRAAKRGIEQFRQRFAREIAALRGGERPDQVPELRQAAFERHATTGAGALERLLQALQTERQRVGAFAGWDDPFGGAQGGPKGASLSQFLRELYDLKIRGAQNRQRQLLLRATEQVANELLSANEQMNLLEYEVGLGIYRRIGRDARLAAEGPKRPTIPRVSAEVYFHFDGEYWTDELPDMQFFIEDRCVD